MKKFRKTSLFRLSAVLISLSVSQAVIAGDADVTNPQVAFDALKSTVENDLSTKAKTSRYKKDQKGNALRKNVLTSSKPRLIVKLSVGETLQEFRKTLSTSKVGSLKEVKSFKSALGSQIVVLESSANDSSSISALSKQISSLSGVDFVEPDQIISIDTNDEFYDLLWGMNNTGQTGGTSDADIDAPEAWAISTGSSAVVVGVIDTGIDYLHPDLVSNIWHNVPEMNGQAGVDDDGNGYVDDFYGIDTVNNDSDPVDDNGHGTHVSGTIGATGNNEIGVVGVNHSVQIAGCKFLDASGGGYTSAAIECIDYFTSLKMAGINVVVTNNSWGGGGFSDLLKESIDYAGEQGIVFAAAAGNDSSNNDSSPHYPSSYDSPSIIAVASTDHSDSLSWFSNYGVSSVDLAAPGSDILSTTPSTGGSCRPGGSSALFHENFSVRGLPSWDRVAFDSSNQFTPGLTNDRQLWWYRRGDSDGSAGYVLDDSQNGDYQNNLYSALIKSNPIDLSSANGDICLSFNIKGQNESNFDYLHLYVSADDGVTWSNVISYDSSSDGFESVYASVPSSYKTSQFRFAFVRTTDSSVVRDGYILDEIYLYDNSLSERQANYESYNGTSMATPHVAGAIALAASVASETVSQRISRVLNNVDLVASLSGVVSTGGRLNVANMLNGLGVDISGDVGVVPVSNLWKTVSLANSGLTTKPIVIAGPPTYRGAQPVVVRLKQVGQSSFKIKLKEWDYLDGSHNSENVSYLAIAPGVYTFPDGSIMEVGQVSVGGTGTPSVINFDTIFNSNPQLLLTVQTNNGESAVVARAKNLTSSAVEVSLFEQESLMGSSHNTETVGYLAYYSAGASSPTLSISGKEYLVNWSRTYLSDSWKTVMGKQYKLQEEQSRDSEVRHANETVSFLNLIKGNSIYHFAQDVSTSGYDTTAIRKR